MTNELRGTPLSNPVITLLTLGVVKHDNIQHNQDDLLNQATLVVLDGPVFPNPDPDSHPDSHPNSDPNSNSNSNSDPNPNPTAPAARWARRA